MRAEAEQKFADGGEELDMVVNISRILRGNWQHIRNNITVEIRDPQSAPS